MQDFQHGAPHMVEPIQELREDLHRFQHLLSRDTLLSCSEEERASLLENSRRLLQRLEAVGGSVLTVGLLGGTGVGKSSLMNSLAEASIASTSHRRPHTERVLIYRHEDVPLPASLELPSPGVMSFPGEHPQAFLSESDRLQGEGAPRSLSPSLAISYQKGEDSKGPGAHDRQPLDNLWLEISHRADLIRHILLCDLPDFDSLAGEHRQRVVHFLEHLDVIVWVTSPEKYADARFYAFLREVPKARQNFYFVLNKADLLFEGRTIEAGYGELGKVIARFTAYLMENEVPHPLIYAVSAAESQSLGSLAPWNQFVHFRHQIFQLRDAREVRAIKAANLDVEVRQFLQVVDREILHLEKMREALVELVKELEGEREEWAAAGRESLDLWLDGQFRNVTVDLLVDPSHLVGPGYLVAQAVQILQKWSSTSKSVESGDPPPMHEGAAFLLQSQMERLQDRIVRRLLHRGLSAAVLARLDDMNRAGPDWQQFAGRIREYTAMRLRDQKSAGPAGFKFLQMGIYTGLFVLFLVALAGDVAWRDFIRSPDVSTLLDLAADVLLTLFSPKGIAALGSYLILLALVGLRFYRRYKKSLQHRTQKFIESLKRGLGLMWEEELQSLIQILNERRGELEARTREIASLVPGSRKD